EHRVVDLVLERLRHGDEIRPVSIRGELHAVAEPAGEIVHELARTTRVPRPDVEARDKLRLGVDGHPRPAGAAEVRRAAAARLVPTHGRWQVAVLGVPE